MLMMIELATSLLEGLWGGWVVQLVIGATVVVDDTVKQLKKN